MVLTFLPRPQADGQIGALFKLLDSMMIVKVWRVRLRLRRAQTVFRNVSRDYVAKSYRDDDVVLDFIF